MTPKKWWHFLILFILVGALALSALSVLAMSLIYPTLPSLDTLTNYHPKQPLRIYSADNALIAEFGEERRAFVKINDVPVNLKNAVLAIEDRRFYQHNGIDTTGVLRAIKNNLTGRAHEGASTITMQVAKNFFTVPGKKRTIITKIKEALLAIKIERTLNKDQILELYINQIYLGQRAFGFAAASQVYFGKPISKTSLAEAAFLAGLPKAPSGYNPYTNRDRAMVRQHNVLADMHRYSMIDDASFNAAMNENLTFKSTKQSSDLSADYVAELVRQILFARYQDAIYSSGLKVYTTIKKANQEAANEAVLQGILDYQKREGYHGPEKNIDLTKIDSQNFQSGLKEILDDIDIYHGLVPAIVTKVDTKSVQVLSKTEELIEISGVGLGALQKNLNDKDTSNDKIKVGSVVRLYKTRDATNPSGYWQIVELPKVESSLIALDPEDGAVTALVGGFDFNRSKFNHVTQAWRQPGSSFKPFIYSASLEKGFTPASIIDDAPIVMPAGEVGSNESWEPKNFDNKYDGPISMRTALTKSKNMVSIRILQKIGARYAQDYITKFGFSRKDHPAYLTMALGAGNVTSWGMAAGYAVFANGGYQVEPHVISKIIDSNGNTLEEVKYPRAKQNAIRAIDGRNAFLMTSMMSDVIQKGTATRAKVLGRHDLAGKTGTTNNLIDAWFAGFSPAQVAVAWIGFDQPRTLGKEETGGKAALPIWIRYMATALRNVPDLPRKIPDGVMTVKINPYTGGAIGEDEPGIYEYFYQETPPNSEVVELPPLLDPSDLNGIPDSITDNPLQPAPPTNEEIKNSVTRPPAPKEQNNENAKPKTGTDAAAGILNPSGI